MGYINLNQTSLTVDTLTVSGNLILAGQTVFINSTVITTNDKNIFFFKP